MQIVQLDEETLEGVANGGEMDYDKWPAILEPLLDRLDQIMHNDFPVPRIPPSAQPTLPPLDSPILPNSDTLQSARIPLENGPSPRPLPPVPAFDSSTTSRIPESLPPSQALPIEAIPDLLIQQFNYITSTLRNCFSNQPPHTVQRFAELVLSPTKHYKTLPAWLRALDRVVSVSSTADIFPLPHAQPLPANVIDSTMTNGKVNGVGTGTGGSGILWTNSDQRNGYDPADGLGSDESLGGALLTPIPWLKNGVTPSTEMGSPGSDPMSEPIDTPGSSMVPEREDGAVTQGELIRQEQEAGIVPVNQTMSPRMQNRDFEDGEMDDSEAAPHARGPDIVGAEDIGLQSGRNVEVNISGHQDMKIPTKLSERNHTAGESPQDPSSEMPQEQQQAEDTDVDGKTKEQVEDKAGATSDNIGPDATDTSTV